MVVVGEQKKRMSCVICNNKITDIQIYHELECDSHLAHGACSKGVTRCPDQVCRARLGFVGIGVGSGQQQQPAVLLPTEVLQRRARCADREREELIPSQPPGRIKAFFGGILNVGGWLSDASKADHQSTCGKTLLASGVPLASFIDNHGLDITELVNDHQVTIVDFLDNEHTIAEMCDAFPSRMNAKDGSQVLCALGVTDEFFRDVPDMMNIPLLQTRLGYTPEWLPAMFGYRFTPGKWTLPQMNYVGLSMPLVMQSGMTYQSEWAALKQSATSERDLQNFGWTPQLEAQLLPDPQLPPPPPVQNYTLPSDGIFPPPPYIHAPPTTLVATPIYHYQQQPPQQQYQQQQYQPPQQQQYQHHPVAVHQQQQQQQQQSESIFVARAVDHHPQQQQPVQTTTPYTGPKLVNRSIGSQGVQIVVLGRGQLASSQARFGTK